MKPFDIKYVIMKIKDSVLNSSKIVKDPTLLKTFRDLSMELIEAYLLSIR